MLTISQVTKAFAGRTLFEDASLQVNRGDRVGLVGPNGAGKSTLFSLILGEASPDEGRVSVEKSATIGFLPQEHAPAGRRNCPGTGLRRFAGGDEGAAHHENDAGRFGRTPRGVALVRRAWRLAARAEGEAHPGGSGVSRIGFRPAGEGAERRLGHARASGALARAGAGSVAPGRADEPSRSRIARLVPGIPGELSRRDSHDLARPRVPESARRFHHRDRASAAESLSGELGQLRRAKGGARRAAALRLQEPAEGDRVAATLCRSVPGQGEQGVAGAEQVEADRSDGEDRGAGRARENRALPFSAAAAQRAPRHYAEGGRSRVWRSRGLSRAGFRSGEGTANGAGRTEWRRKIDAAQAARRSASGPSRRAGARAQCEGRLFFAVSRRDARSEANGAGNGARHAEPGLGADGAHRSRLVSFSGRRCFQDDGRA